MSSARKRRFMQCDVFTNTATKGNGLAVIVDADGLSDKQMQDFAAWTNLAETSFLLPPSDPAADYKVRIFTPKREMPFAGHPTLGSCACWLKSGGRPKNAKVVMQECGVGLVPIHVVDDDLAFEAPPTKIQPMPKDMFQAVVSAMNLPEDAVLEAAVLENGPVWQAFRLKSAADVLAVVSSKIQWPKFQGVGLIGPYDISGEKEGKMDIGLIAPHAAGGDFDYEVRMLAPSSGMSEDPITGSLNAALAKWMLSTGDLPNAMTVSQGVCLGREGRVQVSRIGDDTILIGGNTIVMIDGTLEF